MSWNEPKWDQKSLNELTLECQINGEGGEGLNNRVGWKSPGYLISVERVLINEGGGGVENRKSSVFIENVKKQI